MSNIYETTIIIKPDLANDQLKTLTILLINFSLKIMFQLAIKKIGNKNLKTSINKYSKGSFKFMRFISVQIFQKLDSFLKFNTDCLRFLPQNH